VAFVPYHNALADVVTPVESTSDSAYDDLIFLRKQYQVIFENKNYCERFRLWAEGRMARLHVMAKACQALGEIANMLDEEAHMITPSVEATRICDIARRFLPEE
jgi:hypothetical protein